MQSGGPSQDRRSHKSPRPVCTKIDPDGPDPCRRHYAAPEFTDSRQRLFSTQVSTRKGSTAESRCRISWSRPQTGVAVESALPAFQAGHAGSIPVARSSSSAIFDFKFTYVLLQAICRSSRLPIPSLSSLIEILELNYGKVSDWLDYPSFCPKCQQPQAGAANSNLPPAPPWCGRGTCRPTGW